MIRRANLVRLLYHIVSTELGAGCEVTTFFAGLLVADRAARMRTSAFDTSMGDELALTRMVLTRSWPPNRVKPLDVDKVLSSFPPSRFEQVAEAELSAVHGVSRTLQGWMHGALS